MASINSEYKTITMRVRSDGEGKIVGLETSDGNLRIGADGMFISNAELKVRKRPRKAPASYHVTNLALLYKICDAGFLTELRGVGKNKDGEKVFYFNQLPDIKEIIDSFTE